MAIKFCITCASVITSSIWCDFCRNKIFLSPKSNNFKRTLPFQNQYLIEWNSINGRFCSHTCRSLKNKDSRDELHEMASELQFKYLVSMGKGQNSHDQNKTILIPAPAKNRKIDHAMSLALALEKCGLGIVASVLEREDEVAQKTRSLIERRKTNIIACKSDLSNFRENLRVIFVDDVITSGMTALSAYLAMGKPPIFSVLTLFSRALLPDRMNSYITRHDA
jgi:predicted amidophosphoribosyltransferase